MNVRNLRKLRIRRRDSKRRLRGSDQFLRRLRNFAHAKFRRAITNIEEAALRRTERNSHMIQTSTFGIRLFDGTSPRARGSTILTLTLLLIMTGEKAAALEPASVRLCSYSLLPDSYLIDDCPPCARPTVLESLRGTFDLRLVEENPLFSRYAMENISLSAGSIAGRTYKVVGHGTYTVGGEVALLQDMALEVRIDDGVTNRLCFLTNATPRVERLWPMAAGESRDSRPPVQRHQRLREPIILPSAPMVGPHPIPMTL